MTRSSQPQDGRARREAARRARERRRLTAPPKPQVSHTSDSAVAARQRHEGLITWFGRQLSAIPNGIGRLIEGFAREVLAIVAAIGRTLLGVVPGRRLVSHVPSVTHSVRDATTRARSRPPRTEAQLRVHSQRRAALRRQLRMVACIVLIALVAVGGFVVPRASVFAVQHVEVTGASSVGDLTVRRRVDALLQGETIYTVDRGAIERRLEAMPFVRDVQVVRHLPGGLEIRIAEYRPLALGFGDGRFWLVSRDGRILARAKRSEWEDRIPTVTLRADHLKPGVRVGGEPTLRLLASRTADSTLAFDVVKATRFALIGTLDGGVEVRFGRTTDLRQKLLVAEKVLHERAGDDLLYIDVSVPSRPAWCTREAAGCLMDRPAVKAPTAADPAAVSGAATPSTPSQ